MKPFLVIAVSASLACCLFALAEAPVRPWIQENTTYPTRDVSLAEVERALASADSGSLANLWTTLGLDPRIFVVSVLWDYSVQTQDEKIGYHSHKHFKILTIWASPCCISQNIVFHEADSVWQCIGCIDLRDRYNYQEVHLAFEQRGSLVLFLTHDGGGGTGAWNRIETVFRYIEDKVTPVLSIPLSGHHSYEGQMAQNEYETTVWPMFLVSREEIGLTYNVIFWGDWWGCETQHEEAPDSVELFSSTGDVIFVWDSIIGQYIVDDSRSDCTANELNDMTWGWSPDVLFDRFGEELEELSTNGDVWQQEWIRDFSASRGMPPE